MDRQIDGLTKHVDGEEYREVEGLEEVVEEEEPGVREIELI